MRDDDQDRASDHAGHRARLREFHDIGGVLTADPVALQKVDGIGETEAATLKIAHACALRLVQAEAAKRPILSNWQALLDYLHADMAHHGVERFRVLHLNKWRPVVSA